MKTLFNGVQLIALILCLAGCGGGGGSGSGVSKSNQNGHGPFQFLDATLPQNATNVPVNGLSITLTFSNPINSTQANLDLNASTSDTVILLTGVKEGGSIPIKISVQGPTLVVIPTAPLLYGDQYTLTIRPTLLDIYGQSLEMPTNGDLPLNFTTAASSTTGSGSGSGAGSGSGSGSGSSGMVTLGFDLNNSYSGITIGSITYSLGTQSQVDGSGAVSPTANYNIQNNAVVDATQTTPVIPAGVFASQHFTYNIFYSFQSGTTYYAAMKACMTEPDGSQLCSPYSTEATITAP